ncbi:serine protease snake-like [Chrysoperla carnea]|uniref:serine protease snake-like n=1 Tax=Chrysoperla carnea TaxID=189513 RepID=UPI001D06FB6D|nr:serine protease snake-like [Chrysoperla carnea]
MIKLKKFNICVLLLYIFVFISVIQCHLLEGQYCLHKRSMSLGTCKPLDNCEETDHENNHEKHLTPQLCNWNNKTPIVCCRNTHPIETQEITEIEILETIEETRKIKIEHAEIIPKQKKPQLEEELKMETDKTNGISRKLCLYYAKSVYALKYPVFNAPGAAPQNESQCAVEYRPLIIGGSDAKPKEFPHMALIGYGEENEIEWGCGGSLITEEWVLTAAHCAYPSMGEAKFVRLGELDLQNENDDSEPQNFIIIQIEQHPEYKEELNFYNDIALFKLNKKAKLTAYVRPACLWTKREIKSSKAMATGWGQTSDVHMTQSSHLLKVTLSLIPQSECNHYKNKIDYEKSICAGISKKDKSIKNTCQADSGGPLQIYAEDVKCMYYIIGITSYGKVCDLSGTGVYTRVSNYIPWIESIVSIK